MKLKSLLLGAGISLMIFSNANAHVLDESMEWNGHYYKAFEMDMKWDDAAKFCQSMGGHLATAETREENEMLKHILEKKEGGYRYWLGGVRDKKGIWRWVTGKVFGNYFDWTNGKQRAWNSGGGDYLAMDKTSKCQWTNLKGGSNEHPFLCEWESKEAAHDSDM